MSKIDSFSGQYRFLSNFYPADVKYEGEQYSSVEHAYQAAKTLDLSHRIIIRDCGRPGVAKKLGKHIVLRDDWNEIKLSVMGQLLWQKFHIDPLRQLLIDTDPFELIEGNHWGDVYWGICRGIGENNLGKLLMEIRKELKNEQTT